MSMSQIVILVYLLPLFFTVAFLLCTDDHKHSDQQLDVLVTAAFFPLINVIFALKIIYRIYKKEK